MKNGIEGIGARTRAAFATLGIAAFAAVAVRISPAMAKNLSELAEAGATEIENSMAVVRWVFYAIAAVVVGWAILRFWLLPPPRVRGGD